MPALRNLLSGLCLTALFATLVASLTVFSITERGAFAQDDADGNNAPEADASETTPSSPTVIDDPLSTRQDAVAIQYDRFEKTLRELSEYMKTTDPGRADLLIRAFGQSKKDQVAVQMHELVRLLDQDQLGDALERQQQLVEQLHGLLGLLQSEDRRSEIDDEKKRVQELLKDLGKLISQQIGVRSRTERGEDMKGLSDKQGKVAENADQLIEKIGEQDAEKNRRSADAQKSDGEENPSEAEDADSDNKDAESKDADGKKSDDEKSGDKKDKGDKKSDGEKDNSDKKDAEDKDGEKDDSDSSEGDSNSSKEGKGKSDKKGEPKDAKSSEGEPSEGEPSESEPSEGEPSESQPSEGQPSQGQPSQGQPSKGKPGESQPGQPQEQQQQTPGREEIEQARKEMEKAIEELEKQARDKASGHQDEALRKLAEAKAKLEEILRQLREEERELALQDLEARFQRMLALQTAVYTGTVALHKNASEEQTARHHTRSIKLARDEDVIIMEAEKALTLLRDEGTSVAFPEAVEQIRDDMTLVARRLGRAQTDAQTVGYEEDIIAALKEMIEALQKEIEKAKEQKQQQQQPGQQGQPQDNSLVEKIAELKMLRSLQLRINRRTKDLGKLNPAEQASDPDIIDQLKQLSRRQARLQQATHDIVTGKNK
ncbi:MAG: hypothetical protein WEB58_01650 [Planctomycetaceae bacterium]